MAAREFDQQGVRGLSPALVGMVMGVCAGIPMYLWQLSTEVGVASFVIVGYTAWLWTHSHNHAILAGVLRSELRNASVNATSRRILRMCLDPGFWWTMLFGGSVVTASVWWAGLHETRLVIGVAGSWGLIAMCLRYGLTLLRPTTCCRRCGFNLAGQLAGSDLNTVIRCPECSAKWSRRQLGHDGSSGAIANVTPGIDWRRRVA